MKYIKMCIVMLSMVLGNCACSSNTKCSTSGTDATPAAVTGSQPDNLNTPGSAADTGNASAGTGAEAATNAPAHGYKPHTHGRNDTFVMHHTAATKAEKKREGNFTNGSPY